VGISLDSRFSLRAEIKRQIVHALPFARLKTWNLLSLLLPNRSPFIGRFRSVRFEVDPNENIALSAFVYGFYEREVTIWLRRLFEPGSDASGPVIDVGANCGYLAMVLHSFAAKPIDIHAFEPDPQNIETLRRLRALNPGMKLRIIEAAASDKDGTATLSLSRH
jgi:hypothetical protein